MAMSSTRCATWTRTKFIMFNEGHPIDTITRVAAFTEFAEDVGLQESCWYNPDGSLDMGVKMCVPAIGEPRRRRRDAGHFHSAQLL